MKLPNILVVGLTALGLISCDKNDAAKDSKERISASAEPRTISELENAFNSYISTHKPYKVSYQSLENFPERTSKQFGSKVLASTTIELPQELAEDFLNGSLEQNIDSLTRQAGGQIFIKVTTIYPDNTNKTNSPTITTEYKSLPHDLPYLKKHLQEAREKIETDLKVVTPKEESPREALVSNTTNFATRALATKGTGFGGIEQS